MGASSRKIGLIPGFATEAAFSIFREALDDDAGFNAFRGEIIRGDVKIFRWGIRRYVPFRDLIQVLPVLRLYREEERRALSKEWQEKLYQFLYESQIETVICHSLGSRFLFDMINTLGLPKNVRKIIFVQADIDQKQRIQDTSVLKRINQQDLVLMNIYCPWDQSLLASSLLQRKTRFGMRKVHHSSIQNLFLPLTTFPNLHTSSMKSERLKQIAHQD